MSSETDEDLYKILELQSTSTPAEITKAYRKLALKWHPDKNPGNDEAANHFVKVQKAYEILHDEKAKLAYDGVYKLRLARLQRDSHLGEKQRKMRQDLLDREKQTQLEREKEYVAKRKYEAEVERLRKEGYKRQKTEDNSSVHNISRVTEQDVNRSAKVRWKSKHGTVSAEYLKLLFSQFGAISDVVLLSKGNSAMICFESNGSAEAAIEQKETVDPPRVFKVSALKKKVDPLPEMPPKEETISHEAPSMEEYKQYESLTMSRMRQAAERKRLREELIKGDE